MLPGGQDSFQALAAVHYDACRPKPACPRLRKIHAVLMQQIARCRLQEGFAARIKPPFHQQVYLPEFVRVHAHRKFLSFRPSESSGSKRAYQARHFQKTFLAIIYLALLFVVRHYHDLFFDM